VLVVDNLSPFTPEIMQCLERVGVSHKYTRFSEASEIILTNCDKVILSGRRKSSREINSANSKIVRFCYDTGRPLLGICYGAEIIALTFGGSLRKMPLRVMGHATVILRQQNPLTEDKPRISVYESHAYCVARLPADFKSLGSSQSCEHELFLHERKNIFGTQFHPEKSGPDGVALLQNFASLK